MLTPEEKHRAPPEHTHQWTVALRSAASYPTNGEAEGDIVGGKDDLSHFIKRVTFKLHESFPNPSRGAQFVASVFRLSVYILTLPLL